MINYTWKISLLKKKTIGQFSDVIVSVVWEKTGVDADGYGGVYKILTELDIDNIDSNSFVTYDNLTEQTIIDWIKTIINEDDVNQHIMDEIEKARSQETYVNEYELPWNKVEEIVEE